MEEENVPYILGKWGRFQTRLFAMLTVPCMLKGFQTMIVVIILAVPQHRCRVPGLYNDTFAIQSEHQRYLVNLSIPVSRTDGEEVIYDKCRTYVNSSFTSDTNVTEERDTEKCSEWVYDKSQFPSTVITEFDLVCEQKAYRAHFNLAYMLGSSVGGVASGIVSDWMGRKKSFFVFLTINLVVSILCAFPRLPLLFLLYRFIMGIAAQASYLIIYVIGIEFVRPENRNHSGTLVMLTWVLGPFAVAGLSYVIKDWYILQLCNGLPLILCVSYWWFLPESLRWLLSKGKTAEAEAVIREVRRVNGVKTTPTPTVEKPDLQDDLAEEELSSKTEPQGPRQLLQYPVLIVRSFVVFFTWFAVSATYYGMSFGVTNLSGDVRINFLWSSTMEVIGYISAWLLLDRLGRRRLYCLSMLLAGITCLGTFLTFTFLGQDSQWVTNAMSMVGKLGASAAFSAIYLMTSELFPTLIRNSILGCCATVAKVGSAVSPYIVDLVLFIEADIGKTVPLIVFGAMAMTAGLLSLLLPETVGCKLPDTLAGAASIGKKRNKAVSQALKIDPTATQEKQGQSLLEMKSINS